MKSPLGSDLEEMTSVGVGWDLINSNVGWHGLQFFGFFLMLKRALG
jgi:hypothetical protein